MEKSIYTREYSLFLDCLKKAREDRGLTQIDVAQKLGQTQSFISKVERGERRLDIVELRAICAALGIGFAKFIVQIEETLDNGR